MGHAFTVLTCSWEESTHVLMLDPSSQHLHKDTLTCHVTLKDSSPHLCLSGHWSILIPPGDAENIHTEGDCLRGFSLNKRPSSTKQQQNPPPRLTFPSSLYFLRCGVSPVALGGISPLRILLMADQFLILPSPCLNKSETFMFKNNLHQNIISVK